MPTPCWLKHLCSIRAWVPVSVLLPSFLPSFLSPSLSLSISLFLADSLECKSWLCNPGLLASFLPSPSHHWLWTTRFQSNKGPTFAQVHVLWISDAIHHLILCCPLLLPSILPSIRVFNANLNATLKMTAFKCQSKNSTYGMISTLWHSWKGKILETIKDQWCPSWGKAWIGRVQRILKEKKAWFVDES